MPRCWAELCERAVQGIYSRIEGMGDETAITVTAEGETGYPRLLCRISWERVGGTPHPDQEAQ